MLYPPKTTELDYVSIPARHRDDAIQEAWLAHLEGRDPKTAAQTYAKQESRHERNQPNLASLGLEP